MPRISRIAYAKNICREALKSITSKNYSLIYDKKFLKALKKVKYKIVLNPNLAKNYKNSYRMTWGRATPKTVDYVYWKSYRIKYNLKRRIHLIELNPLLFTKLRKHLNDTITHELAHVIDFEFTGDSWHDATWRSIHKLLGGSGITGY